MQNVVLPFPSSSPSFFRWLRWLRPGQRLSGQCGEFKEAPASRRLHPAAAGGPGPCVWTSFLPWCLPHFRTHQTWTGWPHRFLSTHWNVQPCTDILVSFFSFSCSKIIYIDFFLERINWYMYWHKWQKALNNFLLKEAYKPSAYYSK